ncbi:hypothetical protein RFI_35243 [Reticulomyxa filosa]|uniref:WD-40 repeat protein n=1 Tax=Reticulomyxa filosa TaxID=46433 RepID=X6LN89_RETFI|nr:hypothetical protein RFI_35243 [Reticulomyxa filosa]|eukprot:ETO02195.1 hypothetical protein RFI_35243 [Reticulomyxa filosa]
MVERLLYRHGTPGKQIHIFEGHTYAICAVGFSPDDQIIASGSCDHTIRLWDVKSGKEIMKLEGHYGTIFCLRFSSDGKNIVSNNRMIVSWSYDGIIGLCDVQSDIKLRKFLGQHIRGIHCAIFCLDSRCIASCANDMDAIRIWDAKTGKELRRLEGHTNDIKSLNYFSDGQTLAPCSDDATIRIWNKLEGHLYMITGIDISPDDSTIVSCSWDKTIRI